MSIVDRPQKILVLGGGDGCAVRDILKYESVQEVHLVDLDSCMTNIGKYEPVFRAQNNNSMHSDKVVIHNVDAFQFLQSDTTKFDVIIVDLPDPKTIDITKLYTKRFYMLCNRALSDDGYIITQAGSPQFATKAFLCVEKTIASAGFNTLKLHNNVISLGEWGWVLGSKLLTPEVLKWKVLNQDYSGIETRWINKESNFYMTSFGKFQVDTSNIKVNTNADPVLYRYYLKGNWSHY